jgi:hypothetical protein
MERKEDDLLLLVLALVLGRDDDEPFADELFHRLRRRGRFHELQDPELEYLFERAFRHPRRPRRLEEAREIANSVLDGFRQGFQERVEKQIAEIGERVASIETSHGELAETVERRHEEQVASAYGLHEFIWFMTSGADVMNAKTTRYIPLRLFLGDPLPDEAARQRIVSAVEELVEPLGFERSYELPEESGSWWKRLLLRTKGVFTNEEVQRRLRTAEKALEVTCLEKPQAEANHLQAGAAAQLITALGSTPNACVQVGSLLLVKATDHDGKCAVMARTLTTDELRRIEENQAILKKPEEVLEWLRDDTHRRLTSR